MVHHWAAAQDATDVRLRFRPQGGASWSGAVICGDETAGCTSLALATGAGLGPAIHRPRLGRPAPQQGQEDGGALERRGVAAAGRHGHQLPRRLRAPARAHRIRDLLVLLTI